MTTFNELNFGGPSNEFTIGSSKLRHSTFREDVKCWKIWDEKTEFMKRNNKSRVREADKIKALDRTQDTVYTF